MTEREQWLEKRKGGIGGSEASSIVGVNRWKDNVTLWEEKTGRREPADLSNNDAVQFGTNIEPLMRGMFELLFPQYDVEYDEFGMVANIPEYPELFATLDGTLTHRATGKRGVFEAKSTTIRRKADWEQWKDRIPDYYYTQALHALNATGYEFLILMAFIISRPLDEPENVERTRVSIQFYEIWAKDVQEDIAHLRRKEIEFLHCMKNDIRPSGVISF